jgi:hypothetical protein
MTVGGTAAAAAPQTFSLTSTADHLGGILPGHWRRRGAWVHLLRKWGDSQSGFQGAGRGWLRSTIKGATPTGAAAVAAAVLRGHRDFGNRKRAWLCALCIGLQVMAHLLGAIGN